MIPLISLLQTRCQRMLSGYELLILKRDYDCELTKNEEIVLTHYLFKLHKENYNEWSASVSELAKQDASVLMNLVHSSSPSASSYNQYVIDECADLGPEDKFLHYYDRAPRHDIILSSTIDDFNNIVSYPYIADDNDNQHGVIIMLNVIKKLVHMGYYAPDVNEMITLINMSLKVAFDGDVYSYSSWDSEGCVLTISTPPTQVKLDLFSIVDRERALLYTTNGEPLNRRTRLLAYPDYSKERGE